MSIISFLKICSKRKIIYLKPNIRQLISIDTENVDRLVMICSVLSTNENLSLIV